MKTYCTLLKASIFLILFGVDTPPNIYSRGHILNLNLTSHDIILFFFPSPPPLPPSLSFLLLFFLFFFSFLIFYFYNFILFYFSLWSSKTLPNIKNLTASLCHHVVWNHLS